MNTAPSSAWFVAGTDTEVGKTFVAAALLLNLKQRGLRAVGMKPVAAGTDANGHNDDVETLIAAAGIAAARDLVNPYLFAPPIAPHIAAREAGQPIDFARIIAAFNTLRRQADVVIVEGVGGFCVPLGDTPASGADDLAAQLALPVILVVGMRLGCINHALLTARAITARGLPLAGWIANRIDPAMARFDENLATLKARLDAPLLGVVPANTTAEVAAECIDLPPNPVPVGEAGMNLPL